MELNERHRWLFEFEHRVETLFSYMICSQQRSGSSLLAHMLANTLLAGVPHEYLRQDLIARLKAQWEIETYGEYLRELVARKTSPNGVFGVKVQWNQFALAVDGRNPTELFPNLSFIHLRREDRVRQAVSWVKAQQTGRWLAVGGRDVGSPEFDRARIDKMIGRIERGEAAWERTFERHGITPYRLTYEEVAADPADKTREVLEFVGIDLPPDVRVEPPVLKRQADELSEEWVARYREESGTRSS
jgi:trehalose 2-sulfotransferase